MAKFYNSLWGYIHHLKVLILEEDCFYISTHQITDALVFSVACFMETYRTTPSESARITAYIGGPRDSKNNARA